MPFTTAMNIQSALLPLMAWCFATKGGGYYANLLGFFVFPIFQYHQNTCYISNITFISDRSHRSSAAVAPVKYKCDLNNRRGTFARTNILLTEKITNRALVTPTPGQQQQCWSCTHALSTVYELKRQSYCSSMKSKPLHSSMKYILNPTRKMQL